MNCCVFVSAVDTVGVAVANPSFGNTLRATPVLVGHASELTIGIALTSVALMTNVFIRIVETVVIAITDINSRNAIAVITSEQITKTCSFLALAVFFGLISFRTSAIVVAVAIPSGGYATVVGAAEAVGWTRSLRTN